MGYIILLIIIRSPRNPLLIIKAPTLRFPASEGFAAAEGLGFGSLGFRVLGLGIGGLGFGGLGVVRLLRVWLDLWLEITGLWKV